MNPYTHSIPTPPESERLAHERLDAYHVALGWLVQRGELR